MKMPISLLLLLVCWPLYSGVTTEPQNQPITDSLNFIEKVYLQVDRDSYYPGDDIWFKSYLVDGFINTPTSHSGSLHVELISNDHKTIDSRIIKLSKGLGNGDFHLPETLKSGNYHIRAYTNYMRNFSDELFFDKEIFIINSSESNNPFSVKASGTLDTPELIFFPEGGSLIESVTSVVAFKALDAEGHSYDVTGSIFSSDGQKITDFKSTHKGMGTFFLKPAAGIKYYALIKNNYGDLIRYDLHESFPNGIALSIENNKPGELTLVFKTNPPTLSGIPDGDFSIAISRYNQLIKTYSFRIKTLNNSLKIPDGDLPEGIYMITLSGPDNTPVAERLVYIHNNSDAGIKVETDRADYKQRDSVSLRISLLDSSGVAKDAFISLAAVDNMFTKNTSRFPSSISSWFLLESDIRGIVEDPSYYFDPSNPTRLKDLDLLLLTQGWRDFSYKYKTLNFKPEHGFKISGRARKILSDVPLQNATVTLAIFKAGKPLIKILPLDSDGRFIAEGLDFTGEGRLVASVTGENDDLKGLLLLDSTGYSPAPVTNIAQRKFFIQNDNQVGRDSLFATQDSIIVKRYHKFIQYAEITSSVKKKYKLSDTVALGEVKVIAQRVDWTETAQTRSRHYLRGEPDREIVITPQLENYNNVYQLLKQQMILKFGSAWSPRRLSVPLYLIDGNRATLSDVMALPISLVERIDVVNDPAKAMSFGMVIIEKQDSAGRLVTGIGYPDGAISIILKDTDNPRFSKSVPHSVSTRFSGYNEPRVFYAPRHHASLQSDYKPDLRTTLFWEPDVKISNRGDIFLNYYNGDNSSVVRVTVEGITTDGIPVTASTEYLVQ